MGNPKILFLCGTNSCRSQMAEGFARHLAGDDLDVFSAGVRSGVIHPLTTQVMAEQGIDIGAHTSKTIDQLRDLQFDLIISLCNEARDYNQSIPDNGDAKCSSATYSLLGGVPAYMHWDLRDPALTEGNDEHILSVFRKVRDKIEKKLKSLFDDGCLKAIVLQRTHSKKLFDLLDDAVVVHDEKRRIYMINLATEKLTGRSRDQILGMDCHRAFPPNGLCGAGCAFKNGEKPLRHNRDHKVTFNRPDGESRRISVRSEPIIIKEQHHGVMAVIRDITELSNLRWSLGSRQDFHGMVGASSASIEVFETIKAVSASDYPVLITGESGTGKELAAGAIHRESRREAGPFVPVNCAALPDNILESELFGHVRGAFTGAIRDKKGRFELADGGTLFLDEVGELPLTMQAKLLRVLQEKTFERVGGEKTLTVDVRIVAATNRDLRKMIETGDFREDLFYRLCVVPLDIPPLRNRAEDIPHLAIKITENIARETGKQLEGISDDAMSMLLSHSWPGNIRELINALQYASIRCTGTRLTATDLPFDIRSDQPPVQVKATVERYSNNPPSVVSNDQIETGKKTKLTRQSVLQALNQADQNKVKAAKILGVGRATLYRFFKENPDLN